jgi:hypothetical protein
MGRESMHPSGAYRRISQTKEAMLKKCEHCASHNVRWFTPRSYADRAAVLLCMACRRLTIVPPHARRAEHRVEAVAETQRAA